MKEAMKKSSIKCFVKESYPNLLITDGNYFMTAYITKEAYDQFRDASKLAKADGSY